MQTNVKSLWSWNCGNQLKIFCINNRSIHLRRSQWTHYDHLGIAPGATQGEIKAAYYKLSKMYHPDTNEGSKEAAEKFRTISEAYEVLGNVQRRRMYDKGGIFDVGTADMTETAEQVAVSKFYKSRGQTYSGKTPIYDYDEWSKNHYGKMFERREKAKARYTSEKTKQVVNRDAGESVMMSILLSLSAVALVGYFAQGPSPDVDKVSEKKKSR